MRLIDADALIEKYGDWYTEEGTEVGYIGAMKGIINSAPTIEPKQADDLISRADAMAYPISWENYDKRHGDTKFVSGVESYREYIEYLPPAQPNWFEAAIPPEGGEVYINENGCAIMGAKTFWETQQNWTPCSERLPEEDGRYLVTCIKRGRWAVEVNIWDNDLGGGWLWGQGIVAWMPLPEPYKIEGDE